MLRAVAAALKPVYQADSAEVASERLDDFGRGRWGQKHPAIAQSWRRNWEQVIPFFAFAPSSEKSSTSPYAIDREPQCAGAQGGKNPWAFFPARSAATKLIWLVLRKVQARWKSPPAFRHAAEAQLAIQFEDRLVVAD